MIYDFIEIGTSDFATLIERADENTIGISVEPIKAYLDRLPSPKNVRKINCAISNDDSVIDIYYIDPKSIKEHNLPQFIRGCNSVNKPHPTVKNLLGEFYNKVATIESVKCISLLTLFNENSVEGIRFFKIDTEGHEAVILNSYYEICLKNPNLMADEVLFEYNVLSNKDEMDSIISKFSSIGYIGHQLGEDWYMKKQ